MYMYQYYSQLIVEFSVFIIWKNGNIILKNYKEISCSGNNDKIALT